MKILELDLRAIGPFTDVTLDLSGGNQGFHLIHGPNEAGKTSTLRALYHLLYGFPRSTDSAFVHTYQALRVGATLRHSDGSTLRFLRRKAAKDTLRGPDDRTIVDPKALNRFLGGADETLFRTMFGIDHAGLVQGGREIIKGGGQLGQLLFAAASGVAELRGVQEQLRREMEELFTPQGRNPRINAAIREFEETKTALRKSQLSCEEWSHHDQALRAAEVRREQLENERQQRRREVNRLQRIQNALPTIARRKALVAELEKYRDVILLPEHFPRQRQQAQMELRQAQDRVQQSQQTLAQLETDLNGISLPSEILDASDDIEDLHRRLGEYTKNLTDRPMRLLQMKQHEHDARQILTSLRRPADLAEADRLKLSVGEAEEIQGLGTQQQGVVARQESAQQALAELQEQLQRDQQELKRLPPQVDTGELQRLVRLIAREGLLEDQQRQQSEELARLNRQAAIELGRLGLWSGTLDDLERLAVPGSESLDRFDKGFLQVDGEIQGAKERHADLERQIRELEGHLQGLQLEGSIPSEQELAALRQERESCWQTIRGMLLRDKPPARSVKPEQAAQDYEFRVVQADTVADRLRREADRVARQAELHTQRRQTEALREQLDLQLKKLFERRADGERLWQNLWQPLGIQALTPAEMRGWLRKHADLVKRAQETRRQQQSSDLLRQRIDQHREQLRAALARIDHAMGDPEETLTLLLERAQQVCDQAEEIRRRRAELQRDIARREQEVVPAEGRLTQAQRDLERWRQKWGRRMERLGLDVEASPAVANAFLSSIDKLHHELREAEGFQKRLNGMDRDVERFSTDVQHVIARVAPDLGTDSPDRAVIELQRRLTRARETAKVYQGLIDQRQREQSRLREATERHQAANRQLEQLRDEAGCTRTEDLAEAEQRSQRRHQLEKELEVCREQLLEFCAGADLEAFLIEAAAADADLIEEQVHKLHEKIRSLEQELSVVDQTIGSERTTLERMNGSAESAEMADRAEDLLSRLQGEVQQYAVLRLASAALAQSIDRFRQKNQEPVLARARQLFRQLTLDSFEDLQVEYNEQHEAVLKGIRSGVREEVAIDGMSDGTCDQLYLALRLASLEAYLENHEPLPFVVDDILLNFDNARAAAALRVLGELSRRTQVLFFTHHEHLVELAEESLDAEDLIVHHLPGRASREATAASEQSCPPKSLFPT